MLTNNLLNNALAITSYDATGACSVVGRMVATIAMKQWVIITT